MAVNALPPLVCQARPITLLQIRLQGTSQTMEDSLELGRAIAMHGPTPEALRAYESVR